MGFKLLDITAGGTAPWKEAWRYYNANRRSHSAALFLAEHINSLTFGVGG